MKREGENEQKTSGIWQATSTFNIGFAMHLRKYDPTSENLDGASNCMLLGNAPRMRFGPAAEAATRIQKHTTVRRDITKDKG